MKGIFNPEPQGRGKLGPGHHPICLYDSGKLVARSSFTFLR